MGFSSLELYLCFALSSCLCQSYGRRFGYAWMHTLLKLTLIYSLTSQVKLKPAWTPWSCRVATWSLTLCRHPMACSLAASYEQALLRKCMASWPPGASCPYQAAVSGFALAAAWVFIHPGTTFKHVKWLDIYFLFHIMELAVPGAVFFPLLIWLNSRCACWCLFQVFRATVTEEN